jgi:hypothetical protein
MTWWDELDSKLKLVLTIAAAAGLFWTASGYVRAGYEAREEVQQLEQRYNQHIETQWRDYQMRQQQPAPPANQPPPSYPHPQQYQQPMPWYTYPNYPNPPDRRQ